MDQVPSLELPLSDGSTLRLPRDCGRSLVLYFYPRSNTPGCTTEGHDFNALLPEFAALGCDVAGVSRDSLKTQQNFCTRQGYAFPIASDADGRACEAFDVIREKLMYGRRVLGIERSTFLIDPAGAIVREWRAVRVPGHAAAVLAALKAHQAA